MSTSQVAKVIIVNSAFLGLINAAATWGTRALQWNPQNYLPAVLNAVIGKTVEFVTLKIQVSRAHQKLRIPRNNRRKIRIISALLGTLAAAGLTPKIAQLFGQKITYKASAAFSLSTLALTAYKLYRR